jgi:hypothetical protein
MPFNKKNSTVLSGNFFSVKALLEAGADKTIGENDGIYNNIYNI